MMAARTPSPASPMSAAQLAAALGGTVQAGRVYGPPDPSAAARRVYGHALDPSDMTLKGPCPQCGRPTACGWRERGGVTGRWREVRETPTACLRCRVAAALGDARAPLSASERPADAAPTQPPDPAPDSASWRVQGRAVALSAGVLTVDGRPVADGVSAESVAVYGGRLYVAGRPVAVLAA